MFSSAVKIALKEKQISVANLANTINLSCAYVYDLIKGSKRWNEPTMIAVSKALGITIEYKIS